MKTGDSLTITSASGAKRRAIAQRSLVWSGCIGLLCFALAGCTIEVGPPPESDPPLVSEAEKRPPPPKQPTEPQPWSRDLDFEAGPAKIDRDVLAEGLVAEEAEVSYSRERLTYESAFDADKPPSEAELARQRAKARAEAAGLPPPPDVAAAPVNSVTAESLPATDGAAAPQRRQSRLPPPPKFPPLPPKEGEVAGAEVAGTEVAETAGEEPPPAPSAQRQSRLPPPPKFPPLPPKEGGAVETETAAAGVVEAAAAEPQPAPETASSDVATDSGSVAGQTQLAAAGPRPAAETAPPETAAPAAGQLGAVPEAAAAVEPGIGDAETAAFLAEAWDAPAGTILVQVSAVQEKMKVLDEWTRLQARYPRVLEPLRLVIDEAKLGDRGVFYRVQAGAFDTPEGAVAACDSLISQGQACFVVVR